MEPAAVMFFAASYTTPWLNFVTLSARHRQRPGDGAMA
jgi:hypothetical protein